MTKRVIRSSFLLLIALINLGAVLDIFASIGNAAQPASEATPFTIAANSQTFLNGADDDYQQFRRKTLYHHHHDEESSEKVEERDPKVPKDPGHFPLPLISFLPQRPLSFRLSSYIFQSKHTVADIAHPTTCFDKERYILFRDFRT